VCLLCFNFKPEKVNNKFYFIFFYGRYLIVGDDFFGKMNDILPRNVFSLLFLKYEAKISISS
jgi:hypothetical protein